jgi:hypothetical protein
MILEIATNIDNRVKQMESKMDKRLEELKQAYLSVSAKVRTLEINMTEFSKKMAECEMSCQGLSNLFDKADKQVKLSTRNLIHQRQRIKALEKSIMFNTVLSLEASTMLLLSLIKVDVSVSDILVYIKFKGQIYYVLLLESKVQLHSTFRELFPLSTNQQIAPGVTLIIVSNRWNQK